ncbi:hypothetical protein SDC9_200982 [bioreactor metagenome]|uniref:Uncharacterized protein n=1 Tax=bioreactor metagenome TaxID=1076179 RepID=A0A645IPP5_9ZZZZ
MHLVYVVRRDVFVGDHLLEHARVSPRHMQLCHPYAQPCCRRRQGLVQGQPSVGLKPVEIQPGAHLQEKTFLGRHHCQRCEHDAVGLETPKIHHAIQNRMGNIARVPNVDNLVPR